MEPFELTPAEQQRIVAETLRSQQILGNAQRRGSRYDTLAAVAPLINNKPAAEAVTAAQGAAQRQAKPFQLGNQGFMADGQFAVNPGYLEEKFSSRAQQRGLQQERLLQSAQMQEERLRAQAEQGEANRQLRAQLAADANATRQLLAGTRAADAATKKADAATAKADKALDDQVLKLSTALEKSGASEFGESLSVVQELLTKYPKDKLPGYGRMGTLLPDVLAADETQMVRSGFQQAANILLKARSGAAVTNSEMNRFLREVAAGKGMSETAFRKGWENVARTYGADLNNLMVGVSPEAVKRYEERGGIDYRKRLTIPKGQLTAGQTKTPAPEGVPQQVWDVMTPEEKSLWQK